MIRVENVVKWYETLQALKGISFEITKGETVGFLGPNGAGKTTAMRIITGYFLPNEGKVTIGDFDMDENPKEAKKLLGYLPESPPLYPEMRVYDFLKFVAHIKDMKKSLIEDRINFVISKTALEDRRYSQIKTLSKGLKQRVGIAAAIVHDPEVVILDEPTIGLDPIQIIEIRNLIKEIGENKTIILSSHILAEVQEVCDRVLIINNGEIIAKDTKENLQKQLSQGLKFIVKIGESDVNLEKILSKNVTLTSITDLGNNLYEVQTPDEEGIQSKITKTIVNSNVSLLEIKQVEMTLEEIFAKLIKEDS